MDLKRRMRMGVLGILLGLAQAIVAGQAFGRFGYGALSDFPGFVVDAEGFRVAQASADRFRFEHRSQKFQAVTTSPFEQTIALSDSDLSPAKVRGSLISGSLDLYYSKGFALNLSCLAAPFLSWKDGSVGDNVPTPLLPWVLVSFQSAEPPVVLGFSGQTVSVALTGKPGAWTLRSVSFRGWLRVMLPKGLATAAPESAGSLGRLASDVSVQSERWSAETPVLTNLSVKSDDLGVDAEWDFSGPGALIPEAACLADLGGYPLAVLSKHHPVDGQLDRGTWEAIDGAVLRIHFPVRRILPGRALGLGRPADEPIASVSPMDAPSVADLALEDLLARRDAALTRLSGDTASAYIGDVTYTTDPITHQQLPYGANGVGADLAAAHAMLAGASLLSIGSEDANPLLTSLIFRKDWWTWTILATDPSVTRRATALAAIAGAFSANPLDRLEAGMLQAGLAAERGRNVLRRRRGEIAKEPSLIEPMLGIRQGLFALRGDPSPDFSFYQLLQSPLRVEVGGGVTLEDDSGGLLMKWPALESRESILTLVKPGPLQLSRVDNLRRLSFGGSGIFTISYQAEEPGICVARLFGIDRGTIPRQVPTPAYSETAR